MSDLPFWQQECYQDLVRIWKVVHPNDAQGNSEDDVISLNQDNVPAYLTFADNVGNPTDVGRIRAFSLRRATVCYLTADTVLGPDWFIQDITPTRPASSRFIYRVQEQPAVYPTQGYIETNMMVAMVEHDPHPPEEIV